MQDAMVESKKLVHPLKNNTVSTVLRYLTVVLLTVVLFCESLYFHSRRFKKKCNLFYSTTFTIGCSY